MEFDYIIVGAGSAGCVLANRLTASGEHSVLLLEAGPEGRNIWLHIPAGYGRLYMDPRYYWGFQTEPEAQLGGRTAVIPRGKVLGGSSAINGLVYIRGQREDYDEWKTLGNQGWGYDDVLPYFRKSEDQQRGANAYHGAGGPQGVSDPRQHHEVCDAFIAAAEEAGFPRNDDFNGAQQAGAGYYQSTAKGGWRISTATAFLKPVRGRSNLTVLTGALTRRILLEGGEARGVEFQCAGGTVQAKARREVLLCGGAIQSPQLLQLSGIGPGDLLQRHGIAVIRDLPGVGRGLRDHCNMWLSYRCTRAGTLNDYAASLFGKMKLAASFALSRSGLLSQGPGYAGLFFPTGQRGALPDMQVHMMLFSRGKTATELHTFPGFSVSMCQIRPTSEGAVEIASKDAAAAPKIHFNYLATEFDRRSMTEGLRRLMRVMRQPALAPYIVNAIDFDQDADSDDALMSIIRERGGSAMHASRTCRMGTDAGAVVDARLRVRGVGRLRVIDAAAMPEISSGNTNAPVIMMAEKGADLILEDARTGA